MFFRKLLIHEISKSAIASLFLEINVFIKFIAMKKF